MPGDPERIRTDEGEILILTDYLAAILAFCVSTGLILGLRPIARRLGLVDVPNERKVHDGEVPLVGGIAIYCSVVFAHALSTVISPSETSQVPYLAFYAGAALLVLVGMIDDYRELSPLSRIVVQLLAALIMVYGGGIVVTDLGTAPFLADSVTLGLFAVPFTLFGAVGLINAVNMSDGLDGLAGSLTLVSLAGFLIAALAFGNGQEAPLLVILAASLVAFLMFNVTVSGKRRALIFLGDAGSMLLGFALVWFAISLSQDNGGRAIRPAAALWFLTVPIYDAACMTTRRVLRRRPAFSADKEHLHHIFLLAGFTVNETVLTMAGLAAAGVFIGLAGTYYGVPDFYLAAAFLLGGLLYFWMIVRAWSVMRFLRRSICRRRNIGDRRSYMDRRRHNDPHYSGKDRRIGKDRRASSLGRRQAEDVTRLP